jgi:Zn-dependent protease
MTLDFLLNRLIIFVVLIISVVMHELSHGAVADAYGDPTPRLAGRLTWNPLAHLDPLGTLFIIIVIFTRFPFFGWAKPVPINPAYFRDYRRGMIAVSLAGAFANFSLMLLCMGVLYFVYRFGGGPQAAVVGLLVAGLIINFMLMLFNLLPIPPLDGSKVVAQFLSWKQQVSYLQMERFGFLILVLLLVTGVLRYVISFAFAGFFWVMQSLLGAEFAVFIQQAVVHFFK